MLSLKDQYLQLDLRHHALDCAGLHDSAEAEYLEGEMERLWPQLSATEQQSLRKISSLCNRVRRGEASSEDRLQYMTILLLQHQILVCQCLLTGQAATSVRELTACAESDLTAAQQQSLLQMLDTCKTLVAETTDMRALAQECAAQQWQQHTPESIAAWASKLAEDFSKTGD